MFTEKQKPLLLAHIGDLHLTDAKQQNYKDFLSITAQIAVEIGSQLDFVLLPGDNADNGLAEQYRLITPALKMLDVPVYILTGDHDMEQGSLDNFYNTLKPERLPFKKTIKGVHCIFLDVCGPGTGGPDFRFGAEQLQTLENYLRECGDDTCAVFMHTYPDDLKDANERQKLLDLLRKYQVALVTMGHTHYNEVANNHHTVYTATRSTGQIEEGPVGYSIISIDNGLVSWRFRALEDPFPFVMITSPVDYRLYRLNNALQGDRTEIRATVLGADAVKQVACFTGDGQTYTMSFDPERNDWYTTITFKNEATMLVSVEAVNVKGRPGRHSIEIATPLFKPLTNGKDGSDELSIGAWVENGILGTQLGPNRNAKPPQKKKD